MADESNIDVRSLEGVSAHQVGAVAVFYSHTDFCCVSRRPSYPLLESIHVSKCAYVFIFFGMTILNVIKENAQIKALNWK